MFAAMLLAMPMHWFVSWNEKRSVAAGGYGAVGAPTERPPTPAWLYFLMMAPSLFDLCATALCMFGLVSVPVSLYQMLRGGSSIAFTSLMKHFCLPGEGLQAHNWVGVLFCIGSIVLCGFAASAAGADSGAATAGSPVFGVALILSGGLVQSLQYVFEERVMSADMGLAPLLVVGLEGAWGFALCIAVLLPGAFYLGIDDPLRDLGRCRKRRKLNR